MNDLHLRPETRPVCHRCFSRKDVKPLSDAVQGYPMHIKPCFLCKGCFYELDKWSGFLGFYDVMVMSMQLAFDMQNGADGGRQPENPPTPQDEFLTQVTEVVDKATGEIAPTASQEARAARKGAKR